MININRKKGKIATLIILVLLTLPFFINYIILQTHYITGFAFSNSNNKQENKQNTDRVIAQNNFLTYFFGGSSSNKNRNSDYLIIDNPVNTTKADDISPIKQTEKNRIDLEEQIVKSFKTKLTVRNQPEEAVASTLLPLKTSYDITYNNQKTTIFVTRNDPKLPINNDLAINFDIAKRIGINVDKTTIFEIEVKQRK